MLYLLLSSSEGARPMQGQSGQSGQSEFCTLSISTLHPLVPNNTGVNNVYRLIKYTVEAWGLYTEPNTPDQPPLAPVTTFFHHATMQQDSSTV